MKLKKDFSRQAVIGTVGILALALSFMAAGCEFSSTDGAGTFNPGDGIPAGLQVTPAGGGTSLCIRRGRSKMSDFGTTIY